MKCVFLWIWQKPVSLYEALWLRPFEICFADSVMSQTFVNTVCRLFTRLTDRTSLGAVTGARLLQCDL